MLYYRNNNIGYIKYTYLKILPTKNVVKRQDYKKISSLISQSKKMFQQILDRFRKEVGGKEYHRVNKKYWKDISRYGKRNQLCQKG